MMPNDLSHPLLEMRLAGSIHVEACCVATLLVIPDPLLRRRVSGIDRSRILLCIYHHVTSAVVTCDE
jgi:hypothetical protein